SSDPFQSAVGAPQTVSFRFDQGAKWTISAKTASINIVESVISETPDLVEAFRRNHQVAIETADGHRGTISLDGTGRLTRIASNLLLQAKLPNSHLLSPAETPPALRGMGASWTSEVGTGSVAMMPPNIGHDSYEVALRMIVGGANACKGEFAAGRSTSLVDETLVTKAFTACSDSSSTRTVRFFVLHREGAWYIEHAVIPSTGGKESVGESPLQDAAFQAAVVKTALYQ
ncbi:MAG TPA: hypothetical protein VGL95_06270, partial [Acetobacteraceae bacterium]